MSKNLFLSGFLILFSVSAFFAQVTNSKLTVNIKNQLGEIISDAEVLLQKKNQTLKTLKANKQGIVLFTNLDEGEYQIIIKARDFNDFKSETIKLKIGENKIIEAILDVKSIETDVNIGGDDDVENSGTARVINEQQIEKLPNDPKRLERILRSMAGESATGEQMPITVDGVQTDKLPPKDQIQAIRINQNVFSAQYDNPNGWGIEIYTRSQADKFSGSVRLNYENSRFNAANPFIGKRLPKTEYSPSFYLTGPITKTSMFSMWFNTGFTQSSAAINATILDSQLRAIPFQITFPKTDNGFYAGFQYQADLNKKNKLSAAYDANVNEENGINVEGFSLPSRANNNKSRWHNLRVSETFFVNENLINSFRANASYSYDKNFGGSNDVAVNVLESFFGGGSQNNSERTQVSMEATNDTSWQKDKFSLNFGWRLRGTKIDQNSTANFGGTYTFSGITAPILDANNNPIPASTIQISSLETYHRTLLFQRLGYSPTQIRALGGGASQFTISGGNPTIKVQQWDAAVYVQNSYKLQENLALSFGLRYENQTNINSNFDFAPRLGLIWTPKLKKDTDPKKKANPLWTLPKISVGFGMFYNRYGLNNLLSIKQAADEDKQTFLITDTNVLDLFPNVASASQLQQFALPKNKRFINSNFQTPQMRFFSLSANKKLPAGFSSNFTFSVSNSVRQTVTRNINAAFLGVRPLGNIGNVYEINSIGTSERKAFSASLIFPQNIIWASIRYNFSKGKDDRVSGSGLPTNPFDFSQEFAPNSNDGVHSINSYFSYDLPFDFSIGGDFYFRTGSRFNITTGKDTNGDGFFTERPAFATDLTKPNLVYTKYGVLDPNPSATDKIIPRNLGRGNSTVSFDMSFSKSFGFNADKVNKKPAKQSLNFSIDVSNIFNIVNRGNPIGNMSSPNFLRVISNSGQNLVEASEGIFYFGGNLAPRSISFGMSFRF